MIIKTLELGVRIAFIGNMVLFLWLILDIFHIPIHILGPGVMVQEVVSLFFGIILFGMFCNLVSMVYLVMSILLPSFGDYKLTSIAKFNVLVLILLMVYYLFII